MPIGCRICAGSSAMSAEPINVEARDIRMTSRASTDRNLMSDDKTKKRPQDASLISLTEKYEVNWWCEELNCTKAQLEAAVAQVGHSAKKVREYLAKK
ncbi:MAG TPA: DUF3606 domain-containing protein [Kofleriaceae bacterium]|jgi:hypothetical protein